MSVKQKGREYHKVNREYYDGIKKVFEEELKELQGKSESSII